MILYYSYLALGAFIIALLGTRFTIVALRRKQLLIDMPNARSNHRIPVPRGGGIAVVMTIVMFLMIIDASYWLLLGILLLAAVSLVDDWIELSPITRILVQVMAVMVALLDVQVPLLFEYMPPWLAKLCIIFGWLWFINLYNFMDGIDGIACTETISIAAGILCISALLGTFTGQLSLMSLIVMGAGIGFLWWNWHPAKIFLGDVGSIPLGFLMGYMLLRLAADGFVWAALIIPAYFLTDATLTLLKRIYRREKIWRAHSTHFYQQAVRSGMSHDMVVRFIFGVNMLLILLACLSGLEPSLGWLYLSIAYGMVCCVLFFVLADGNTTAKKDR